MTHKETEEDLRILVKWRVVKRTWAIRDKGGMLEGEWLWHITRFGSFLEMFRLTGIYVRLISFWERHHGPR